MPPGINVVSGRRLHVKHRGSKRGGGAPVPSSASFLLSSYLLLPLTTSSSSLLSFSLLVAETESSLEIGWGRSTGILMFSWIVGWREMEVVPSRYGQVFASRLLVFIPFCQQWQCVMLMILSSVPLDHSIIFREFPKTWITAKGAHQHVRFVLYQLLIGKEIDEVFSSNCGIWPLYAACRFNELSRESILGGLIAHGMVSARSRPNPSINKQKNSSKRKTHIAFKFLVEFDSIIVASTFETQKDNFFSETWIEWSYLGQDAP